MKQQEHVIEENSKTEDKTDYRSEISNTEDETDYHSEISNTTYTG